MGEGRSVILVADDDEDILDLICLTLEQAGHETLRAHDGEEALSLALRHRPDACVLDVVMPERTGLEIIEVLRDTAQTTEIPVLLLTATVRERDLPPGIEKTGKGYLRKPFSPRELQDRVAWLLRDRPQPA
jgi:DNA-binding response OmpR family regulator